jgi:hypothetical protein
MDYTLRKGEVISMTAAGAAEALSVCAGRVWLTRAGDPRDHLLTEGDRFPLGGAGSFVLEALADATIALEGVPQRDARATVRVNLALTRRPLPFSS